MTWAITAAGTVTLDDVTTPAGRRQGQLGGSAVYFGLAAARFAPVRMVAVHGRDAQEPLRSAVAGLPIDTTDVAVGNGQSFQWRAVHDFDRWVTESESSDEGPYRHWLPALTGAAAASPVLFVGSMRPESQLAVVAASSARLVGADSMTVFIDAAADAVRRVAEAADVLFLDRREVCALAGEVGAPGGVAPWLAAARALVGRGRLRAVVVKAGPEGATLVTARTTVRRAAIPVDAVVDPTGAGDALAGGFLGACAQAERDDDAQMAAALDAGLRTAAAAVAAFGTERLRARPGC